jgi:hypothetical protein
MFSIVIGPIIGAECPGDPTTGAAIAAGMIALAREQ